MDLIAALAPYEVLSRKSLILDMLEFIGLSDFRDENPYYPVLFVKRDMYDDVVEVYGYHYNARTEQRDVIRLYNKEE
jgi:hypothetical protein